MLLPESEVKALVQSINDEIRSSSKQYINEALDHPLYGLPFKCYILFKDYQNIVINYFKIITDQLLHNEFYWLLTYSKLYLSTTDGNDLVGINDEYLKFFEINSIEDFEYLKAIEDDINIELRCRKIKPYQFMQYFN
jgi:hypothetical protein